MHSYKLFFEKTRESLASVLPITALVLLSVTAAPLDPGTLVLLLVLVLFGALPIEEIVRPG